MGLDMYLKKELIGERKAHEKSADVSRNSLGMCVCNVDEAEQSVVLEVAYWRKANAIHKWFIDNCANGIDSNNFEKIPVSWAALEQLLGVCEEALDIYNREPKAIKNVIVGYSIHGMIYDFAKVVADPSKLEEILPTRKGFFFGSNEYGETYKQHLEYTIDVLKREIGNDDFFEWRYYYVSSW